MLYICGSDIYMFHTPHNIFYFMHQDECRREIGTYSKYMMQLADLEHKIWYVGGSHILYISYTTQYFLFYASIWIRRRDWKLPLNTSSALQIYWHQLYCKLMHLLHSISIHHLHCRSIGICTANLYYIICIVNLFIICAANLFISCTRNLCIIRIVYLCPRIQMINLYWNLFIFILFLFNVFRC